MHTHRIHASKLLWTIALLFVFLCMELIGGIVSKSLTLLSDAAHMLTDIIALFTAWIATHLSQKPADYKKTFGYYRFEILAAAFNTMLLFGIGIYILYQALVRLFLPIEIHSPLMFFIGIVGLIVNFIALSILHGSHHDNLNLKSAYLEVLSDFLSSFGVILGAILIFFYNWQWVDSVIAILIACWVLPRGWIIFKESMDILLEAVPKDINIHDVFQEMRKIPGVINIHDLHVWSINNQRINLTAHVIIHEDTAYSETLKSLETALHHKFKINHSTLQLEYEECMDKTNH